tara:strand:- start:491 stop:631 length:141 start_codon:yes stop_codon:yes gene_type:complete
VLAYLPEVHIMHVDEALFEYVPTLQFEQDVAPAPEYLPHGHILHSV